MQNTNNLLSNYMENQPYRDADGLTYSGGFQESVFHKACLQAILIHVLEK